MHDSYAEVARREELYAADKAVTESTPLRQLKRGSHTWRVMYVIKATRVHPVASCKNSPWLLHGSRGERIKLASEKELTRLMGCKWVVIDDKGNIETVAKADHPLMPGV